MSFSATRFQRVCQGILNKNLWNLEFHSNLFCNSGEISNLIEKNKDWDECQKLSSFRKQSVESSANIKDY